MFDPEKFLEFAKKIIYCNEDVDREAKRRTAINRAYYATFLTLREYLSSDPKIRHWDVYFAMKRKNRVLAKKFDKLWIRRIAADYYLKLPISLRGFEGDFYREIKCDDKDVQKALMIADEIINKIKSNSELK
ncbi:MAG: hypothetical protein ACTSSP_11070 [Candidatus Asgardarchaeia archaeon]